MLAPQQQQQQPPHYGMSSPPLQQQQQQQPEPTKEVPAQQPQEYARPSSGSNGAQPPLYQHQQALPFSPSAQQQQHHQPQQQQVSSPSSLPPQTNQPTTQPTNQLPGGSPPWSSLGGRPYFSPIQQAARPLGSYPSLDNSVAAGGRDPVQNLLEAYPNPLTENQKIVKMLEIIAAHVRATINGAYSPASTFSFSPVGAFGDLVVVVVVVE
jgi:hypothetical protein